MIADQIGDHGASVTETPFSCLYYDRFEKDLRLKEDNMKTMFDLEADISYRLG